VSACQPFFPFSTDCMKSKGKDVPVVLVPSLLQAVSQNREE